MIKINEIEIKIEHFPDGTLRLKEPFYRYDYGVTISWIYEKEEELSALIYLTKHIKQNYSGQLYLQLYYCPNARMDRVHKRDEVFTLKHFADVVNWLGFTRVTCLDTHSNVTDALIDRIEVVNISSVLRKVIKKIDSDNLVVYFPDAGACKRYAEQLPSKIKYIYGMKNRDWDTGNILGIDVVTNGMVLAGKDILMVDDICAYGGTFYYGAKELKNLGVNKIYAYATHTENSVLDREKGTLLKSLEDGTVEKLFTTRSLFTGSHEKIEKVEVSIYG